MVHAKKRGARAGLLVLVIGLVLTGCRYTGWNDTPSKHAAGAAAYWLAYQQLPADGSFERVGFPGFETPDAILAIGENAQEQNAWNAEQARVTVREHRRNGLSPLHAIDDLVDGGITAGQAAKLITLVTVPLGLSTTGFDPDADGARNLVAILDAGKQPNGSYGAFNATLYAALANHVIGRDVPANTVALIRNAQEAAGGWDFNGDPAGNDADVDTTALAIQALVASKAGGGDADLRAGLAYLAGLHRASGAWPAFGSDDPNSTAAAVLAITAAGFDPDSSCWRDVVNPSSAGDPYPSPLAWLRSQQASSGRIKSPNDSFGVNTFATSQTIQAFRRGWVPVATVIPQNCP